MEALCIKEVAELHQFFQDWFNGAVPGTVDAFARCAEVLHESFLMVSPQGVSMPVEPLLQSLREMHGKREERDQFRIWAEPVRFLELGATLGVLMYEEWQSDAQGTTGRLSSAVFRLKPGAPCGVEWVHLHETWLPRERISKVTAKE